LGAAKPQPASALVRADEEVVADSDNPDRHWFPQRAVLSEGGYRHLFSGSDLVELLARPGLHQRTSFSIKTPRPPIVFSGRSFSRDVPGSDRLVRLFSKRPPRSHADRWP